MFQTYGIPKATPETNDNLQCIRHLQTSTTLFERCWTNKSHHCGASRSASGDHPSFSCTEACWTNLVNISRLHQWSYQHLVISKQIGWVKGCLEKWQKNHTNTYKNLISNISKISIISNKFTNQTSHRQQNQKPRLAWGSGFAVTVEAIFLGSAGFCKDLLRDPKDAMEFFGSETVLGKGVVDTGLGSFLGCWSWSFQFWGENDGHLVVAWWKSCCLIKGWWKKACSNCSNQWSSLKCPWKYAVDEIWLKIVLGVGDPFFWNPSQQHFPQLPHFLSPSFLGCFALTFFYNTLLYQETSPCRSFSIPKLSPFLFWGC